MPSKRNEKEDLSASQFGRTEVKEGSSVFRGLVLQSMTPAINSSVGFDKDIDLSHFHLKE